MLQHTANTAKFNRVLDEYTDKSGVELLQVTELGVATAMRLQQKIAAGEFVAVAADRVAIANDRAIVCNFLDHPARFPLGPFALAVALEAPVLALNCIKLDGRYHIHFEYLCRYGAAPATQRAAAGTGRGVRCPPRTLLSTGALAMVQFFSFLGGGRRSR